MSAELSRRVWRGSVVVCAALSFGAAALVSTNVPEAEARTTPARSAPAPLKPKPAPELVVPREPVTLDDAKHRPSVRVHPPASARTAQPLTVMLHGMCDEPEWECPWFADAATPRGWLVCPRANLRCEGGGSIWSTGRSFSDSVEGSVERLKREYPEAVDDSAGRTLVGFSLGALRAMDLAHAGGDRYRFVILIGAKVEPNADKLRKAGVERILLAAGDYDMMKWHMAGQAKKLARQGFPAAFMSLGKVGHTFPRDLPERMTKALGWVHGDDAAFQPRERGEIAFVPAS